MHDKERNIKLYNVLKERLIEFGDDPKKAFAEPVYMPISQEEIDKGQEAHQIKSVKLKVIGASGILLPNGFANNDSMPRVDVFSKPNKKGKKEYYLIPIYVADFARGELPDRFATVHKQYDEWRQLDDTYKFEPDITFFWDFRALILYNKNFRKETNRVYKRTE